MLKPKLLVFASGTKVGGGSGFENLVRRSREGILDADIVTVVSNHLAGGVRERADRLGIPFIHFPKPWDAENYQRIVEETNPDFISLSGWLKLACGLDSRITTNIHPGPLPGFGGQSLWGHHVHEAVMAAFRRGEIRHSAVSMHFIVSPPVYDSGKYDLGPVFFRSYVEILDDDTPETLAARVNAREHKWQPVITNLVVRGEIRWDGVNLDSLEYPSDYQVDHFE